MEVFCLGFWMTLLLMATCMKLLIAFWPHFAAENKKPARCLLHPSPQKHQDTAKEGCTRQEVSRNKVANRKLPKVRSEGPTFQGLPK